MRVVKTIVLAVALVALLIFSAMGAAENGRGSDIIRQWIVCQYVNAGQNPWDLSRDVLVAKYGEGNPGRISMYRVPPEVPPHRAKDVIPELGPPEATYPPPAIGLLAPTIGLLPTPNVVLWVWFAVNVAAVGWVAHGLARLWPVPPGGGTKFDNIVFVLAALVMFSATHGAFVSGQFSLLVLSLLLVANDPSRSSVTRGVALGIALLKPSLALPFVLLPLVHRQWRVLFAAAAVQALATAYVMLQTESIAVVDMVRDWLAVSGFFLNGQYTLQEYLNALDPIFPWIEPTIASLGMLGLCGLTLFAARRLAYRHQFALVAVTSLFWTYHLNYDYLILLPVLMPLAGWAAQRPGRSWSAIGVVLLAILSVLLTPMVTFGEDPFTHIIRWTGRFIVVGLVGWEYGRVYWSIYRDRNREPDRSEELSKSVAAQSIPSPSA